MKNFFCAKKALVLIFLSAFTFATSVAQTVVNGFYPKKGDLTIATSYGYKSYQEFYRGTELTDGNPAMLGDINSSIFNLYSEYGITDWLSANLTLPYIIVKSEAGNPDPVQGVDNVNGIQDLGLYLKGKVYEKKFDNLSSITLGASTSYSLPVGDYQGGGVLSLGNRANDFSGSVIIQYTSSLNLFTELQTGYSMRNSADFDVPNAFLFSAKIGYYNDYFYLDTKLGVQNSQSGLDIGTPQFGEAGGPAALPETDVDFTNLNFSAYVPIYKKTIGISAGYGTTLNGRNYSNISSISFGIVYTSI